jgi:hypothetical protein
MLTMTDKFNSAIKSPVRTVAGKVELRTVRANNNSFLSATYTQDDYLKSIKIERVADESKFFGFGIAQKLNVKLRDVNRELSFSVKSSSGLRYAFKVYTGVEYSDGTFEYVESPFFYITETHRDENTNELSVTAYDALYFASVPFGSVVTDITAYDTYYDYAYACKGIDAVTAPTVYFINCDRTADFEKYTFPKGANIEGTESCREILDDIAEATHTVYYIDSGNHLCFKRPDRDGDPVLTISRSDYFTLKSGDNRRLGKVIHATELGDNVSAATTETGTTQIIRDNVFFTLLAAEDLTAAINETITNMGGLTMNQFDCSWRGTPALEPGDKIALVTKDGNTVCSFLYSDTIEFDGTMGQKTEWKYTADELETESTPTSLGDAIKQVYAKVDRVNKEISLVVGEEIKNQIESGAVSGEIENIVDEKVSSIKIDTDSITAEVMSSTQQFIEGELGTVEKELATIKEQASMTMTKDQVKILIEEVVETEGASSVTTGTGFTFNDQGLTISKDGTEMKTNIDEDGMSITRGNEEVLTADNTGVKAENLHATTYLIIGVNSRFEDYDNKKRTGCFWIGE